MPGYRNIGGTWRIGVWWRNIGGTWRQGLMWRNVGGTWKVVAGAPQVTLSPSSINQSGTTATVTSSSVVATVTGSVGSLSYLWSKVSGGAINLTATTTASTSFQATGLAVEETRSAVFRCTVTDTATGQTGSADINVTLRRSPV